jgi:23S rRNA G2445 N2-methylase RlmL
MGAMSRTDSPPIHSCQVIAMVPPGLEQPAAAELEALGAEAVQPLRRAVACRIDQAGFYRLHLRARLPFRILRELARFPCRGREDLYGGVQAAADWAWWLPPQRSFRVEASGTAPGLTHSHYSALQVKNASGRLAAAALGGALLSGAGGSRPGAAPAPGSEGRRGWRQ